MIVNNGEYNLEDADDANIPVNISISKVDFDGDERTFEECELNYQLTASNYCPRKSTVYENIYCVYSTTLEELQELLKKHVLPLYKNAFDILTKLTETTDLEETSSLYYWG